MTKTVLNVVGMSCPSCIQHVSEALAIAGVGHVDVKLDTGTVEVDHEVAISSGRLIAALQQAGYEATTSKSWPAGSRVTGKVTCCGQDR